MQDSNTTESAAAAAKPRKMPQMLLSAVAMGALGGVLFWLFLILMERGILLLWELVPEILNFLYYPLIVCALGGIAVGLLQKKYGKFPETLEVVIEKFRKTGSYGEKAVSGIFFCAIVPLVLGGCIGPEAGLSGVIFGFCTWIGSNFKDVEEKSKKRNLYAAAGISGVLVCYLLTDFLGGGMEFHRFDSASFGNGELLMFIPLAVIGVAAGFVYTFAGKLIELLLRPIKKLTVLQAVIGGLCLGLCGVFLPNVMFSGEVQMGSLMAGWENMEVTDLLLDGLLKLVMVSVCIKTGWRGGHIFPLIFAGLCFGFAASAFLGIDSVYATAVVTAALCGMVMKQPLIVAGVLLIFYPVTSVLYVLIAAFAGSKIGGVFKEKEEVPEAA